jgi:hypothetical protein
VAKKGMKFYTKCIAYMRDIQYIHVSAYIHNILTIYAINFMRRPLTIVKSLFLRSAWLVQIGPLLLIVGLWEA